MSRHAAGLMAWLVQRATAVYLAGAAVYLLLTFSAQPPADHAALVAWISQPLVRLALLLAVLMLLAHAWVGVRDVLIDYVHPLRIRLALLLLSGCVLLASGLWLLRALLIVDLGDT